VADNSTDGSFQIVEFEFPSVTLLKGKTGQLVPHLWKLGYDEAKGKIIAFTSAQCIPNSQWIEIFLKVLYSGASGVGGPILSPNNGSSIDWALYFSRYSAFLPTGSAKEVATIPGENAAYKSETLRLCVPEIQNGFWETLVHLCFEEKGINLIAEPKMGVRLASNNPLADTVRQRIRHGRHFGSTRPGNNLLNRLSRLVSSPMIAPYLLFRIVIRVYQNKMSWIPHLIKSLPLLTLLLTAWTIGEIGGYLFPERVSRSTH